MYPIPKVIPIGWKEIPIDSKFKKGDKFWFEDVHGWGNTPPSWRERNTIGTYKGLEWHYFTIRKIENRSETDLKTALWA